MGCSAVIHMDPVAVGDKESEELKQKLTEFAHTALSPALSLHDFRLVKGRTHTNVIFDIVVPYDSKLSDAEIKKGTSGLFGRLAEYTLFCRHYGRP